MNADIRRVLRAVDNDLDDAERAIHAVDPEGTDDDFGRVRGLLAAYIHTARCILTPFIIPAEAVVEPCRDDTSPHA